MTEPTASSEPTQPDAATRIAELEGQVALLKDTVLRSNADQQNQQRRHQPTIEPIRAAIGIGHVATVRVRPFVEVP